MKVVIVGGGFGGVKAALDLANKPNVSVQLVSSQSHFEYHAALYRSATGRSPLEVAIPLHDFFGFADNVTIFKDAISSLDIQSKSVTGRTGSRYHYDVLILGLGNTTEYYGIKGLREYTYGIKTLRESLAFKRHLHDQLLHSDTEKHYIVIGAGASGIELSAELATYIKKIRKKHAIKRNFTVDLVEAGPQILPAMPQQFSRRIKRRLRSLRVKLYLHTTVQSETVDSLLITSGAIASHTVIWTAGVTNNPFFNLQPDIFKLTPTRRVVVDQYLQAASDIYVIGDSADTPYSGMAQTAMHNAAFVADDILRIINGSPRRAYQAKRPVYAIPAGPHWAAVSWGKINIYGRAGWVLRRLADLRLFWSFLPAPRALKVWHYGQIEKEVCPICK